MITSGFTSAPVSKFIVFYVVVSALIASVTDTKYYLHLQVDPHLWPWGQFWRIFTWQACYTNSTEVLFATLTFYHLRTIERLWGTRKFASFLLSTLPYTTLLPPLLLTLLLRPLTFTHANHLPGGPTPLLFALLAQYHAAIPHVYKYRVALSTSNPTSISNPNPHNPNSPPNPLTTPLLLTSKTLTYLPALQLALSQVPGSLLTAAVGWTVGSAFRNDALPGSGWRVPGWVVGEKKAGREGFDGLRRRL
ncbi:hypothetical protein M501DRAFT_907916, partial [Patellaria atrata CBS 101060]